MVLKAQSDSFVSRGIDFHGPEGLEALEGVQSTSIACETRLQGHVSSQDVRDTFHERPESRLVVADTGMERSGGDCDELMISITPANSSMNLT